jgi:hypothetical protein
LPSEGTNYDPNKLITLTYMHMAGKAQWVFVQEGTSGMLADDC